MTENGSEGTYLTTIRLPMSVDHFLRLIRSYDMEHPHQTVVLRDGDNPTRPELWVLPLSDS